MKVTDDNLGMVGVAAGRVFGRGESVSPEACARAAVRHVLDLYTCESDADAEDRLVGLMMQVRVGAQLLGRERGIMACSKRAEGTITGPDEIEEVCGELAKERTVLEDAVRGLPDEAPAAQVIDGGHDAAQDRNALIESLTAMEARGRAVADIMHAKGETDDPILAARLSDLWQSANTARAVLGQEAAEMKAVI